VSDILDPETIALRRFEAQTMDLYQREVLPVLRQIVGQELTGWTFQDLVTLRLSCLFFPD
jgi:hypothetical protein